MYKEKNLWFIPNYITPEKIANYLLNTIEIKIKRIKLISFPYILDIEPSAICNTDCQLCPVGLKLSRKVRQNHPSFMKFEDYQIIIDRLKKHLLFINFGLWGEPTLNPAILLFIDYAHRNHIRTHLLTNGHNFTDNVKFAKDLFEVGLDSMLISLHGVSKDTFTKYQPSKDFEKFMETISQISSLRNRKK
jgi:wyosine [tRNA(Phe)-imidazoG37] synthetase (radical SAM superfamily)